MFGLILADVTTVDVSALMSSSATTVVNQVLATVASVTPIGLAVVGAVIAVTFGIKFIKKLTKG